MADSSDGEAVARTACARVASYRTRAVSASSLSVVVTRRAASVMTVAWASAAVVVAVAVAAVTASRSAATWANSVASRSAAS
jgi:hypothetical protein